MRSKLFVFIFCVSFSKLSYADNRYFGELRYINPIFSTGDNKDYQTTANFPDGSRIFTDEEENYAIALGLEFNKNHSLAISFEDKDTQWRQNNFTAPAGMPNYNYIFRDLEIQNLLLEYNYIFPVKNWFKIKGIVGAGISHLENRDIIYFETSGPGGSTGTATDTPGAGVYDFSHKFGVGLETRLTGENYINLSWVRTNYGKAEANTGNFRPATETEIIEEQIILGIKKYF